MNDVPVITAKELLELSTWTLPVHLPDGSARALAVRRLDKFSIFFSGVIDSAEAGERLARIIDVFRGVDPLSAVVRLDQSDRDFLLGVLRRYACTAVIQPCVVMAEAKSDELPVEALTIEMLFRLFDGPALDPPAKAPRQPRKRARA